MVALEAMHLEAEVPGMLHTEELEVRNFSGVEQRGLEMPRKKKNISCIAVLKFPVL